MVRPAGSPHSPANLTTPNVNNRKLTGSSTSQTHTIGSEHNDRGSKSDSACLPQLATKVPSCPSTDKPRSNAVETNARLYRFGDMPRMGKASEHFTQSRISANACAQSPAFFSV
jgi:hypothetical protein